MTHALGERLIFVLGAPRSGTTLLMRMLNVHPEILTRPEPHLLTPLAHLGYYAYADKAPYDPFQAAQAAQHFVSDLPNGEADYLDALRAYCDTLYGRTLAPSGRRYFLDKTPAYALILPFIAKLYPNAVFIILSRHPFAIFSSFAKSFFDDDWNAAHDFNPVVERYIPAMGRFLRERPVSKIYHLRYEDLAQHPEHHLKQICQLADLPYTEAMLNYGQTKLKGSGLGDPVGVQQHSKAVTSSIHRWTESVHNRPERVALLKQMVDALDDRDLDALGYPRQDLFTPLNTVNADRARATQRAPLKWDRHHTQRRLLLHLRKNIHHNALGSLLQRVRFACDVLLRE